MPGKHTILRRVHLSSPREEVYRFVSTAEGRRRFWAESVETDDVIEFRFANGQSLRGRVLDRSPPERFAVEYFGGSRAEFELHDDGAGGTDLTLTETDVPEAELAANSAGWVTVLLTLKAAVEFSVDLRNGDPRRGWEQGYVDV